MRASSPPPTAGTDENINQKRSRPFRRVRNVVISEVVSFKSILLFHHSPSPPPNEKIFLLFFFVRARICWPLGKFFHAIRKFVVFCCNFIERFNEKRKKIHFVLRCDVWVNVDRRGFGRMLILFETVEVLRIWLLRISVVFDLKINSFDRTSQLSSNNHHTSPSISVFPQLRLKLPNP